MLPSSVPPDAAGTAGISKMLRPNLRHASVAFSAKKIMTRPTTGKIRMQSAAWLPWFNCAGTMKREITPETPHQKAMKIQSSQTALRDDEVTRPSIQSFRLSHGFSAFFFAEMVLSACFFALIPKMSAMSPPQTTAALKSPLPFLPFKPLSKPSCKSNTSAKSPMSANGAESSIGAFAGRFWIRRRGRFVVENPVFPVAHCGLKYVFCFSKPSRLSRQSCDHDSICSRLRLKLFNGNKLNLRDDLFVFLYLVRRAKQQMHNAKMNAPDFGGIVVDQADWFRVE
jgi:hypothetical protein